MSLDGVAGAVQDDLAPLGRGTLDVGGDLVAVRLGDERAHLGGRVGAGADLDLLGTFADLLDQRVADGTDRDDRGDRHAALAGRAVGRAHRRVRRRVEVGVGQHQHVVLGAAEGLHALAVRGGGGVDVAGDGGRADEGDGLHVRVLQEAVHGHLVAVHDIEDAVRQTGLGEEFGELHGGRRVLLARLEHEGVATGDGEGEHPQRHHRREVERRNARDDTERLPDRGHVDAGGDLRGQLALELHADAAGQVDDLQAARDLSERVGVHLAVLGGDQFGDLVAVRVQQRAEREEDRGPLGQGGLTPGQVRLLGGGDGGVHLVDGGEGHLGGDLAGRRVRHRPVRARGAFGGLAADPVVDDVRHDRELLRRWRRRVETCRWCSSRCSCCCSRAGAGDGRVAVTAPTPSQQPGAPGGPDTVSAVWASA